MRKDFENYQYEYNLSKDWIFPFSEIAKGSNIILYGAGDVGQAYYTQILQTAYCNLIIWVDRNYKIYCEHGLPVESPEAIKDSQYDYIVIAVYNADTARDINNRLLDIGVSQEKVVWIGQERHIIFGSLKESRLYEPCKWRIEEIIRRFHIEDNRWEESLLAEVKEMVFSEDKLCIPRIVVEMTSFCTLHCEHCNNLMPMYKKPSHISLDELIADIDLLLKNVDKILTLELIGGEPLIYPHLSKALEYVLEQKNISEIEITTNGTVIPSMELISLLKDKRVTVKVSVYSASSRLNELIKLLDENSIRHELLEGFVWIDSGNTDSRNRSAAELKSIYRNCDAALYCKTLFKGKLYACARAASLYDLGICLDERGYIDIRESDNVKRDIRSFYLKEMDISCDYCNYTERWRQVKAGN